MRAHFAAVCIAIGFFGCSSDTTEDDGGTGGSSSTSSSSTGGAGDPWAKPECADPNKPLGGTPDPRTKLAGGLSPEGLEMMVFGGDRSPATCADPFPPRDMVGETWILDVACGAWEQLNIAGPSARTRMYLAQDPARNQILLFGGRFRAAGQTSGPYTPYNDLWAFDWETRTWGEITTQGDVPAPRYDGGAVIVGDELWIVGGNTSADGLNSTPRGDAYALDLNTNTWRLVSPDGSYPGRQYHSAHYDADSGRIIVLDGDDSDIFNEVLLQSWAYDIGSGQWSELASAGADVNERARFLGEAMFRPSGDAGGPALFTFMGHDVTPVGLRNDVQRLDLGPSPTWTTVSAGDTFANPPNGMCDFPPDFVNTDLASPERRQGFAIGTLPDGGAAVIVGGDSDCGRLNDAWWFNTGTGQWTPIRETLSGLGCPRTGSTNCVSFCQ